MERRSGPGRVPSHELSADDLVGIVRALEQGGVDAWLDGGWAVDAVLGAQTRPHDDLDLVVEARHVELVRSILGRLGFAAASASMSESFELVDTDGRQVDVHAVRLDEAGDGIYRLESGADWRYPADGFTGVGVVHGARVRCLTPEVQLLCHSGYEPHRDSYNDVWALCRRFGLRVPDEYRRPRETYPVRSSATR